MRRTWIGLVLATTVAVLAPTGAARAEEPAAATAAVTGATQSAGPTQTVDTGTVKTSTATCPNGWVVTGGGIEWGSLAEGTFVPRVLDSFPASDTTWRAEATIASGGTGTFRAWATCASAPAGYERTTGPVRDVGPTTGGLLSTAACDPGATVLGGGVEWTSLATGARPVLTDTYPPTDSTWLVSAGSAVAGASFRSWAVCATDFAGLYRRSGGIVSTGPGTGRQVSVVDCDEGDRTAGGGVEWTQLTSGSEITTAEFEPGSDSSWIATALSDVATSQFRAWAICMPDPYYSAPVTPAPYSAWDPFVARQFYDFTGTRGTTSSRAGYVTNLTNGTTTPAAVITYLMGGTWFSGAMAPVSRLYWAYFDRIPDYGGVTYWTAKRRNGTSLSKISQSFAASSEFKRKYGSITNRAFVLRIYVDVLKRTADQSGLDYWTRKLNSGTSRGQVMVNFSESNEYKGKMAGKVNTALTYAGMLNRKPTTAELTAGEAMTPTALAEAVRLSSPYSKTVVPTLFEQLRASACAAGGTPAPARAAPGPGADEITITDTEGAKVVLNTDEHIVYSTGGPDQPLPRSYSFNCDPEVFVGTLDN